MASQATLARAGEDADLQRMAAELLAKLSSGSGDGKKGGTTGAWDQLQGKLAQVATYTANPSVTLDDLLSRLDDAKGASFLHADRPEAEALLIKIMSFLATETDKERESGMAIHVLRQLLLVVADELDMVPLRDSEPVYMVDADSNFCEANVANIIKSSPQLSARNAPYSVVSIVGAQSSGKSYLLNRLFGTMFPEMDAKLGRSQTTRGIMMSRCIGQGASLLVLDVEGFDGREKGQNTLFEKQAALFALTVSDIMLVNMSVFDIGREQAGGTLLFKTIFKERVKLEAGLTKILVVLRMYDGETPLENLKEDMMANLEKIWRSANGKSQKYEDYIEVNVVGLPDKFSPSFPEEVTTLRRRLSETNVEHNRSAKVLASSFSVSSKMFWDSIKNNKKLDIPSHQVALSVLFCQQAAEQALKSAYSGKDYKILKTKESPRRFKELSDTILKSIIIMYDHETELFDIKVRDNERQHMLEQINKVFIQDSWELIRKLGRITSEQFKGEYAKKLKSMEETDLDLAHEDHIVDSCIADFMKLCEDVKEFDLDYLHRTCVELKKDLQSYIIYQGLIIKETRARKETELARQKSEKNVEDLLMRLDKAIKDRQNAEAEMASRSEKMLKDEKEYSRQMLAKHDEQTKKMLAAQQEQTKKMLSMQQDQEKKNIGTQKEMMERMLAAQRVQADKKFTAHQEQTERLLAAQRDQENKNIAAQKETTEMMLAAKREQADKKFAAQQEQTKMLLSMQQRDHAENIAAQKAHAERMLAAQQEQAAKALAEQRHHAANMLAAQKKQDKCNIM